MAVVQISRIQIRRGQKQVTGMPQLASGELAWAVDTQELYIGNGSVFEGSPAVGNTKILTQNDLTIQGNLLNLLQHLYKANDTSIITNPDGDVNFPITRKLQDRLDDRVTVFDFGATGDGVTDDTLALQQAINQLFFNSASQAYLDTPNGYTARRILEIPAGKYIISDVLLIPSYATIVGAGSDKTIIEYTPGTGITPGPMIKLINDAYPVISGISSSNEARFITLKDMTLYTATEDETALELYCVRNSLFENLIISGELTDDNEDSIGIRLDALSAITTCERNKFTNVTVNGFNHGVYSAYDILDNTFDSNYMHNVKVGFSLGFGLVGGALQPSGIQFGPRNTLIANCKFENVKQQAVYIGLGTGNVVKNPSLSDVGQGIGGVSLTQYPQIYFKVVGNEAVGVMSDRWEKLSTSNISTPYVPEVSGLANAESYGTKQVSIGYIPVTPVFANRPLLFRLPVVMDSGGGPIGSIVYTLDYVYQSTSSSFTRRGTLTISADIDHGYIQLSDEFDYTGPFDPSDETALHLDFSAGFLTAAGTTWTTLPGKPYSIVVRYQNDLLSDAGKMTFSYKSIHSKYP